MGAVFAIFAGFSYWFPLIFGFTKHERWAKAHFILIFVGVNITFFPQHFLGLAGIPRRYPDYPDRFRSWNNISSNGSILTTMALILFIFILWEACVRLRATVSRAALPSFFEWINLAQYHHRHSQPFILTVEPDPKDFNILTQIINIKT